MAKTTQTFTAPHLAALLRKARKLAPGEAEDLVQDTCLSVLKRLEKGDVDNLRAYANATLRNLARTPPRDQGDADPDSLPAPPDCALAFREVLDAVSHLPDDQKRLLLSCLEGASYSEMARATDLPLGTVMSRISRARAALRAELNLPADHAVEALIDP